MCSCGTLTCCPRLVFCAQRPATASCHYPKVIAASATNTQHAHTVTRAICQNYPTCTYVLLWVSWNRSVNFQIDTLISRPSALADVLLATANAKQCPCPSASAQSETPLNGQKKIRPKRTSMHYLRERTAGDPTRAFRGWTPGLRACRAPVQQRPTAPNIVKMAEGGKRQRNWWLYNE